MAIIKTKFVNIGEVHIRTATGYNKCYINICYCSVNEAQYIMVIRGVSGVCPARELWGLFEDLNNQNSMNRLSQLILFLREFHVTTVFKLSLSITANIY